METRQGKIEEKFLKFATNKAAYATFKIDGKNYNTFDKEIIDAHNPDDFVEFTGEQRGKFWTMETMKKIDESTVHKTASGEYNIRMPTANGAKEYHLSPEEVKCRALESAVNTINLEEFEAEGLLSLADKFVKWIRNGN